MNDKIRLLGLSFYGYHGVSESEKETGRMFEVDCEVETDLTEAGKSDNLEHTINYESLYLTIRESVENKKYSLLEKLAEEITQKILDKFAVYQVTLRIRKMNPPIAGHIRCVEVEICRQKN